MGHHPREVVDRGTRWLAFTYGLPTGLDFSGLDLLDCGMKPDAAMTSDIVRMVLGVARLGENDLQGGDANVHI